MTFRDFSNQRNEEALQRPSFSDLMGAAFRRETTVGSAFSKEPLEFSRSDAVGAGERVDSDYFEALSPKYRPYAESFVGLTREGGEALKRNIDLEIEDQETLALAGGLSSFGATMAVQIADPVNFVPFAGAPLRGASFARKLKTGAQAGFLGTVAQEPILNATQETRTLAESGMNLGAGVLFGMALGSSVHAFDRKARAEILADTDAFPTGAREEREQSQDFKDLSSSAVAKTTKEDLEITSGAQQFALDNTPGVLAPAVRLNKAESLEAQKLSTQMLEQYFQFEGAESGAVGRAAETAIKTQGDAMQIVKERTLNEGFEAWLGETEGPSKFKPISRMKARVEFGEQVGRALRRGDVSESPAVAEAAQTIRAEVLDPMLDRAVQAGLLPEGLTTKTALSYFRRAWNQQALDANQVEFEDVISRYFREGLEGGQISRQDFAEMRLAEAEARLQSAHASKSTAKALRDIEAEVQGLRAEAAKGDFSDFDAQEVEFYSQEAARSTWNTLTGRDGGFESPIVAAVQGPLKGRTLLIPDERVEQFLNDDAYNVLEQYIRTMTAEIELTERFGRADMRVQIKAVQDEYSDLKKGKNQKQSIALDKERDQMVGTIEASRDILRGTYLAKENGSPAGSIARGSNAFNFVRMLGDVVLSSGPDAFRTAQVHGLKNLIGPEGMSAFMQSVKALKKTPHENFLRKEAELAGIAEVLLSTRVQAMADLHDPYAGSGPIESTMRSLANVGGLASGMNHWNQFWKQVGFQHGVNRFHRIAEAGGWDKAAARDRKWLRGLKVSKADMNRIAEEMKKHGTQRGQLFDPNSAEWNPVHARIMREALRSDVDSIVVTPGAGDKPLASYHPIGAVALQFKSFFLAAHSRALMRGLGEDQTDFLTGAATMVAMGSAIYYLKSLSGNFETSDNPGVWIAEGLDRSGVLSVPMEVNNMMEPFLNQAGAGGVYTGLSALMGDSSELSSRYRFRRDFIGQTLLGPTASTIKDGSSILSDVLKQGITGEGVDEGTVGASARMIPFANHPVVKQLMRYFAIPELKEAAGG